MDDTSTKQADAPKPWTGFVWGVCAEHGVLMVVSADGVMPGKGCGPGCRFAHSDQ